MNIVIIFFIFIVILFLYIHILYHLKTADDLEIYEINSFSRERLNEVCDLRQPVLFSYNIDNLNEFKIDNLLSNYSSFDIKVKFFNNLEDIVIPLKFKDFIELIDNKDTDKIFTIENNSEFLEETCLNKKIQYNDLFFKPLSLMSYEYDILIGKKNQFTKCQYNLNYRNYFIVLEGKIKLKLAPPKSNKYLNVQKDYESFKFYSNMNIWDPQIDYINDYNKIKFLEIELTAGNIINIPAYWWFSFYYLENKSNIICLKYRTYMNNVTILPEFLKYHLQRQNIKHELFKKVSFLKETPLKPP